MVEIVQYIDDQITACTDAYSFGLCHLIESDNQIFPATIEKKATKAIPNDKYDMLIYHRLLNGQYSLREDLSFGKKDIGENAQKIKTVVFLKIDQDQNIIDDVINALPGGFEVDGYQSVFVTNEVTLIRDRKAIWNDEYDKSYMDRYQQVWQIYALEYDVKYIKCNICV